MRKRRLVAVNEQPTMTMAEPRLGPIQASGSGLPAVELTCLREWGGLNRGTSNVGRYHVPRGLESTLRVQRRMRTELVMRWSGEVGRRT